MRVSGMSDADYIAFLEQQIAGAVTFLRQKDATEEGCIKRVDQRYKGALRQSQDLLRMRTQQFEKRLAELAPHHDRYAFLRRVQVQAWSLGIAAAGENLDRAIDVQIKRQQEIGRCA